MADEIADAIDSAARLLIESRYVVALVGAGLSAESGIPTFRGPGGLWTREGEPGNSGFERFLEDPAAWWRDQERLQAEPERAAFRDAVEKAEPNRGHYALAELEHLGVLKFSITQNIDNLHYAAGSRRVAEIHGNRTKLRCIDCESRWPRDEFDTARPPLECPECGAPVKSDTVMFGEPIPREVLDVCFREVERCDCMLVAGTSATVYPAAGFPLDVAGRGGHIVEANPNETPLTDSATVVLTGPTGETLPRLVSKVRELSAL